MFKSLFKSAIVLVQVIEFGHPRIFSRHFASKFIALWSSPNSVNRERDVIFHQLSRNAITRFFIECFEEHYEVAAFSRLVVCLKQSF